MQGYGLIFHQFSLKRQTLLKGGCVTFAIETFTTFLNSAKNVGSPQNKVDHIDSLKCSAPKVWPTRPHKKVMGL